MKRIRVLIVILFLLASLACTIVYFMIPVSNLWLHLTIYQIAISFIALAVLSIFISPVVRKLRRFDQKFAVPNRYKFIARIGFGVAVVVFAIFGYVTATSHDNSWSRSFLVAFYAIFPGGAFFFGVLGFTFFVSATLCLLTSLLERGTINALTETFRFFVFPAIMVFELWLSLSDTAEMSIHATLFLSYTPLTGIVTNWFVFVVSTGLFALGLAYKKLEF
jgi:hypothetical protein